MASLAAAPAAFADLDVSAAPPRTPGADVRAHGARGDGVADDTQAFQKALSSVLEAGGGSVYIPSGRYRIAAPIVIDRQASLDIVGDGFTSILSPEHDGHLFLWHEQVSCRESTVRNLRFAPVGSRAPETAMLACMGGVERSLFANILFQAAEGGTLGGGITTRKVCDTTTMSNCTLWGVCGTGVEVAQGSEFRMVGGRIIGTNRHEAEHPAKGVVLTGNNGGVHILTTDIIGLHTALQIGVPGGPNNREIFITHATIDSCIHGIVQLDSAYTSIAGCWAASCDEEQILIDDDAAGAVMTIAGGTIFNGGAYNMPGAANGMVVKAGSFVLQGATIRHNKGVGLMVGDRVRDYAVTGCRIANNGVGVILGGNHFAFTGNVLARNHENLKDNAGESRAMTGNLC